MIMHGIHMQRNEVQWSVTQFRDKLEINAWMDNANCFTSHLVQLVTSSNAALAAATLIE